MPDASRRDGQLRLEIVRLLDRHRLQDCTTHLDITDCSRRDIPRLTAVSATDISKDRKHLISDLEGCLLRVCHGSSTSTKGIAMRVLADSDYQK